MLLIEPAHAGWSPHNPAQHFQILTHERLHPMTSPTQSNEPASVPVAEPVTAESVKKNKKGPLSTVLLTVGAFVVGIALFGGFWLFMNPSSTEASAKTPVATSTPIAEATVAPTATAAAEADAGAAAGAVQNTPDFKAGPVIQADRDACAKYFDSFGRQITGAYTAAEAAASFTEASNMADDAKLKVVLAAVAANPSGESDLPTIARCAETGGYTIPEYQTWAEGMMKIMGQEVQ